MGSYNQSNFHKKDASHEGLEDAKKPMDQTIAGGHWKVLVDDFTFKYSWVILWIALFN